MTTNTKAILIAIGTTAILIAGALYYSHEPPLPPFQGEPTIISIEADIANLKTIIETDLQPNGKYKRRDKEMINGIEYETHEYETPKGEIGYVIYITKEKNGILYRKTKNTGVETYREHDWIVVPSIPSTL